MFITYFEVLVFDIKILYMFHFFLPELILETLELTSLLLLESLELKSEIELPDELSFSFFTGVTSVVS